MGQYLANFQGLSEVLATRGHLDARLDSLFANFESIESDFSNSLRGPPRCCRSSDLLAQRLEVFVGTEVLQRPPGLQTVGNLRLRLDFEPQYPGDLTAEMMGHLRSVYEKRPSAGHTTQLDDSGKFFNEKHQNSS